MHALATVIVWRKSKQFYHLCSPCESVSQRFKIKLNALNLQHIWSYKISGGFEKKVHNLKFLVSYLFCWSSNGSTCLTKHVLRRQVLLKSCWSLVRGAVKWAYEEKFATAKRDGQAWQMFSRSCKKRAYCCSKLNQLMLIEWRSRSSGWENIM